MTKDETKQNEEVIAKNGVKAMLFDDVQRLILRQYTEVFPNYVWTDYMAAIDVMAAEVKVLRSELLDALSLATSLREVANAGRTSYRTDAEWDVWKKMCARLEALLLEVRGRHYAATLPAALGLTDSAEGPIRCGTFSEKAEAETKTQDGANYNASMRKQVRDLRQKLDETEKSLAESRKHCIVWAEQVSRAEGDRDIAPALAALNALHRVDIVNLLAQYDAVIEGRTDEEIYTPDPVDAAVVEDIRLRWLGPEPGAEVASNPVPKREDSAFAERESFAELCSALQRQAEENERSDIGDACVMGSGSVEKPSRQPQPDIADNTQSLQQKDPVAILEETVAQNPAAMKQFREVAKAIAGATSEAASELSNLLYDRLPEPKPHIVEFLRSFKTADDVQSFIDRLAPADRSRVTALVNAFAIGDTAPTDPMRIAAEVRERRAEQDKQWGGPKHDDEHFPADWVRYIRKAARQATTREAPQEAEGFEDYMLDIAALAVAAIESSRRKRASTAGE